MATSANIQPTLHSVSIDLNPNHIISEDQDIIRALGQDSLCTKVACWIFCCVCLPCCRPKVHRNVKAIDAFYNHMNEKYGIDASLYAQELLGLSLNKAKEKRRLYSKDAVRLLKYADLIHRFGVATIMLTLVDQPSDSLNINAINAAAVTTKKTCDIELVASLFRLYDLYSKLSKGLSFERINTEINDRANNDRTLTPITTAFVEEYFSKLTSTYLIVGDLEILLKKFIVDQKPKNIFEFEFLLAYAFHNFNYRFLDFPLVRFSPHNLSSSPQKLSVEEWHTITTTLPSTWHTILLIKIHKGFQLTYDMERARAYFEEFSKTADSSSSLDSRT